MWEAAGSSFEAVLGREGLFAALFVAMLVWFLYQQYSERKKFDLQKTLWDNMLGKIEGNIKEIKTDYEEVRKCEMELKSLVETHNHDWNPASNDMVGRIKGMNTTIEGMAAKVSNLEITISSLNTLMTTFLQLGGGKRHE